MKTNAKLVESTADAIVEAGFSVLSRNPGANIAEIASAAQVTRATLHRYFPSRAVLVAELAKRALAEMDAAVTSACHESASAGDVLRDSFTALIPLGDRHGFLAHEHLQLDDAIEAEFLQLQATTAQWIDAAKLEGVFDQHIPTEWINRTYDYLLYAAWDSVRRQETTPKQAAKLAWRTLTTGLGEAHEQH